MFSFLLGPEPPKQSARATFRDEAGCARTATTSRCSLGTTGSRDHDPSYFARTSPAWTGAWRKVGSGARIGGLASRSWNPRSS